MEIRPMCISDYDQVYALWMQCEGMGLDAQADSREGIESYLDRNKQMSFVAIEDGRVIAAVLAGHDGRRGLVHHLAVAPQFRRRGIGRAMVERAVAALKKEGIGKCHLFVFQSNVSAQKFWQKIGFSSRDDLAIMSMRLALEND